MSQTSSSAGTPSGISVSDPVSNCVPAPGICGTPPVVLTGDVSALAGSGVAGFLDGSAAGAQFYLPIGVATDGIDLFVADCTNNRVRRVDLMTGVVSTLAGSGTAGYFDSAGSSAEFNCPSGLATDGVTVFVADALNHRIRAVAISNGAVSTIAGSGSAGYGNGTGTAAWFNVPSGIVKSGTKLYVADSGNNRIREIETTTGAVTTIAGSGFASYWDGTGTGADFYLPYGVTTDGTNLYVADSGNHVVRKIVILSRVVTTLAGSGAASFADGTGTGASFNNPYGVTTDGTYVFVADYTNHRIRRITITSGVVATLAGSGIAGYFDGAGTSSQFNGPADVTYFGTFLYVADKNNNRIRKIQ